MTFGTQNVKVIFDSGSSDTWLAQTGFQCVTDAGAPQSEGKCRFGPLYKGTFDEGSIAGENFIITYGDGEFLTGGMGHQDITLAGLKVAKQEAALVTRVSNQLSIYSHEILLMSCCIGILGRRWHQQRPYWCRLPWTDVRVQRHQPSQGQPR